MATTSSEMITLECTVCKNRNYCTTKNKKTHPDTKITDEDAMLLYQNFISDRLDN